VHALVTRSTMVFIVGLHVTVVTASAIMEQTEQVHAHVTRSTLMFIVGLHVTVVTASATTAQTELVHAHVLLPTPSVQIVPFHGQPLSLVLSVQL